VPALQLAGTLSLTPEAIEAVSKGPAFDMAAKLLTSNPNLERLRAADTQVGRPSLGAGVHRHRQRSAWLCCVGRAAAVPG
jgi:hypothetical protein